MTFHTTVCHPGANHHQAPQSIKAKVAAIIFELRHQQQWQQGTLPRAGRGFRRLPLHLHEHRRPKTAPPIVTTFPRFGSGTFCPECHLSVGPMEKGVVPGPKGSRWHSGCLVCGGKAAARSRQRIADEPGVWQAPGQRGEDRWRRGRLVP